MKGLKNSRPFAAICLAVVIVLSVFLGGLRSVKKLEKKAGNAYYTDYAAYGKAEEDVKKLNRYAGMLYSLCLACDCSEQDFGTVVEAFDKAAGDPYLSPELYHTLFSVATLSYNVLVVSPKATDQQKTSAKQYLYEMESTISRLAKNQGYNGAAKKYNAAISGIPVRYFLPDANPMIVFD